MKKILLLLCLGFIPLAGIAPIDNEKVIIILKTEPIQPYEALWKAVCLVESGNNPKAYNVHEKAVGIVQIRPIRLKHFNRLTGKHYTMQDMYDIKISKEIFMYFANRYPTNDLKTIAKRWNGSGKKTEIYWQKIKKHL